MSDENERLESLLEYIRDARGFDFTGYKRTSLKRRIDKRMGSVGIDNYEAYMDLLQADPAEFKELFDVILINVTAFFRDNSVWEFMRTDVLPGLGTRGDDGAIRIWCAGCASGEEAYTISMLMAEELGIPEFRERVKIYATDVDEEALEQGRRGTYTAKELEPVPEQYRLRYFDQAGDALAFRRDMRRSLIFGRHDLVQDAPISRTDLIVCRNTLMYMNSDVQSRIMTRFLFSLRTGGYLVLGRSEMLFTRVNSLAPVNLKARVFVKGSDRTGEDRLDRSSPEPPIQEPALGAAFEENPTAQVVVGNDGNVYHANRAARRLLHIEQSDIGRPLQDLEFSYRPVELRSLIDEARESGQPAERRGVVVQHEGTATLTLNILVKPLLWEGRTLGFDVLYADISQFQDLRQELETSNQELETAMEELQSSNEELETTNEELQSTNEELETTNEELQSTNEELETMNEELQSTNEELETVNQELHERNTEVDRLNRFMSAMLGGIEAALVVLASDLRVEAWNRRSEDMWGLRAEEVNGQSFLNLDIGLPLQQIRDLLRAFISGDGGGSAEVDARNRSGHSFRCQLTLSKLKGDGSSENIMLMMVEAPPGASR